MSGKITGKFRILFLLLLAAAIGFSAPALKEARGDAGSVRAALPQEAPAAAEKPRPSVNGQLHVSGTGLADRNGTPVTLRGVSTHGITWYPDFVNESLFRELSADWNASVVRLAMYSEDYCGGNAEENLLLVRKGIDAAIAADLYVIVDWHILSDYDPNLHLDEAMQFFDMISAEYAGVPNLIYEICNEPNGNASWENIRTYAETVIPVIRSHSPEAVIVTGTPDFDRNPLAALRNPLTAGNILYAFHFYAGTHGADLRCILEAALDEGLPVFVTESGVSEEDGGGEVNFSSAAEWYSFLDAHGISFTVWSLSNKAETSALIRPDSASFLSLRDSDLSGTGLWVRSMLRGEDPSLIPVPHVRDNSTWTDFIYAMINAVGNQGFAAVRAFGAMARAAVLIASASLLLLFAGKKLSRGRHRTYDDLPPKEKAVSPGRGGILKPVLCRAALFASGVLTLIYLCWRVRYSVPFEYGPLAVAGNLVLLAVEIAGFLESLVHYENMMGMKHHPLPSIKDDEYPEVDIFISTYNEPAELLRKTINGCVHLDYPDRSKVHIWLCDDNRRPEMKKLAERMGIGYFDRPDHEGLKAGNLNSALKRTSAPYIVTFDADMIPKSDFLLKTIPYFVDAEQRGGSLRGKHPFRLGLLQTPQCFYEPDVYQHALYSETNAPNEEDFFYRTIEPAKTSANSVIYGGSNTVLSRQALLDAGGFYTESITEDFATGLLIESAGYVSLALPEPLASGKTPHTFREHVKQRTRWARGVIRTAKKLKLFTRPGLSAAQRLSYWSSVAYWYSPLKNLVYLVSPLLFAVFGLPILKCSWMELLIFWLPMCLMQDLCLRLISGNTVSAKWSGIYETSVMPYLLIPVLKETLGFTLSEFQVTDKSEGPVRRRTDYRAMAPFLVLAVLSAAGIARVLRMMSVVFAPGLVVLLFWLFRNLYYIIMALFLIDGRDSDSEPVKVIDAEPAVIRRTDAAGGETVFEGITTLLTEHSVTVFLDDSEGLRLGDPAKITIFCGSREAELSGIITGIRTSRQGAAAVHTFEILDFGTSEPEYLQILYDRVPTLPQSLARDSGVPGHLWRNIARRLAGTSD